jgi:hypothetical protein
MTKKNSNKKNSRVYFTKETEQAIVRYNNEEDQEVREQIFRDEIYYPLDKLSENIINRFKFPYMDYSFKDVKDQVVGFLVLNLHKYSADKGKAFSYFSVIAKNYLILNNNNRYKIEKRSVYLSDMTDGQSPLAAAMTIDMSITESQTDTKEFIRLMLEYWEHNLTRIFKKKKDIQIADAILELFRRAEGIENFNKKALYLMVREMTGFKTSNITKVVNKMSGYMKSHMGEFRDHGTITDHAEFFTYK